MVQEFFTDSLFTDVQLSRIFPDGKTFVDCIPKISPEKINQKYIQEKKKEQFDLSAFVKTYFDLPSVFGDGFKTLPGKPVAQHVEDLWDILTRKPDPQDNSTLISLPYPYIVPGGRFGEIYYWDSYFTMLGLAVSGRWEMIEHMVNNFSFLIDTVGYIPNGNRTYYIGRSQPPFFSLMVKLLAARSGGDVLVHYIPQLKKEHAFWMNDNAKPTDEIFPGNHLVQMPGGEWLNRYWDEHNTPRPESYREDIELADEAKNSEDIFRNLRAGAESGWDFSSRWFRDPQSFATIHTTDIIPVDLNCLLYHLELVIAEGSELAGDSTTAANFRTFADKRKSAIDNYCWHEGLQCYTDFDITTGRQTEAITLAACFPLFFQIADEKKAAAVKSILEKKLLFDGGLVTTIQTTGQQWDAPNGWAPLQWIAIRGLEHYGYHELAALVARRWIQLNDEVFQRTGKLMEKYNVVDTHLEAGGGEYQGQDGFGWTNGVLLALIQQYRNP
ncbi:MAG: alpha,alpha-trehalase TreF [Terrimonas sp.]|nr:alpha,alpha-trehalase TreF [Terrimonas sp.]